MKRIIRLSILHFPWFKNYKHTKYQYYTDTNLRVCDQSDTARMF